MHWYLSFRERLIHLLAVRPYKKPELYAKVKSGKCALAVMTMVMNDADGHLIDEANSCFLFFFTQLLNCRGHKGAGEDTNSKHPQDNIVYAR